jgi:hypothetical protein
MSAAEEFADVARRFTSWCRSSADPDAAVEARTCLGRLIDLYRAGLALPRNPPSGEDETGEDLEVPGRDPVTEHLRALPFQYYSEIYNPLPVDGEGPVVGDLHDDLWDIYVDIVEGLAIHDEGDPVEAVWSWQFSFAHHWGMHAVSAIRSLHWWLEDQHEL